MIRTTLALSLPLVTLVACAAPWPAGPEATEARPGTTEATAAGAGRARELTVRQEPGKIVYWVLPGPRRLSEEVFGTPEDPKTLVAPKIEAAKKAGAPKGVIEVLRKLPILVGVPLKARAETENGQWVLKKPNPFGNEARIVQGSFEVVYHDTVAEDPPGPPGKTTDSVTVRRLEFEDPAGNSYRVVIDHVIKPPLPGYETEGGVMVDSVHHGTTGTGSPLMPEVKTHAAFWAAGDLWVNGELAEEKHVVHMMTTEVVRNRDYELVFGEDLPLPPGERHIATQEHHTHLVVLPIEARPTGPAFSPLKTAFELPNGKRQPFIHVMFEQDEIAGEESRP